jgi:vacuolar-type H+-ATPase subunit E/Vma4
VTFTEAEIRKALDDAGLTGREERVAALEKMRDELRAERESILQQIIDAPVEKLRGGMLWSHGGAPIYFS